MKLLDKNLIFFKKELLEFAEISGDWNPIHFDQEFARRYASEEPIIHGIHTLIKVLNKYLEKNNCLINQLKCNFLVPILPNIAYQLYSEKKHDLSDNLYLYKKEKLVFNCNLIYKIQNTKFHKKEFPLPKPKSYPLSPSFDELKTNSGEIELRAKLNLMESKYNKIYNSISNYSLASLISTSKLVGMICPGLNSLFSSLSINFCENDSLKNLHWEVTSISKNFMPIVINFKSPGLIGSIKAFYRDPPVRQKSINELKKIIKNDSMIEKNILIIGSSRGLGELTAKLLGIRKSHLTLTFSQGKKDFLKVLNEIRDFGSKANYYQLDILDSQKLKKMLTENNFDQIYLFASPRIKESPKNLFDLELYEKYNSYYVNPLIDIANALSKNVSFKTKIFYPSTIFLDEESNKTFPEYKASKLLGEIICKNLSDKSSNTSFIWKRLPRLLTDQTIKVDKKLIENSIEVVENILELMQNS